MRIAWVGLPLLRVPPRAPRWRVASGEGGIGLCCDGDEDEEGTTSGGADEWIDDRVGEKIASSSTM